MSGSTPTLSRRQVIAGAAWAALAVGAGTVGWSLRPSPVERVVHRLVPTDSDLDAIVALGRDAIAADPSLVGDGERALHVVARLPHGARVDELGALAHRDAENGAMVAVRGWRLPRTVAGLAAAAAVALP